MEFANKHKITPFLWFDDNAEDAIKHYTSIFKNASVDSMSRYPEGGLAPAGSFMTGTFTLEGLQFIAINAGPHFKFNESVSFFITCEDQAEVDYYWDRLTDGGEESQCGWLKDKFGLSWQVVPSVMGKLMTDPDREKSSRVMQAMMQMKKLDIKKLQQAAEG